MTQTNEALALGIAQALYDKQAEDIRVLDVRGISTVTDICVVASGTSAPHLKALQKAALMCCFWAMISACKKAL